MQINKNVASLLITVGALGFLLPSQVLADPLHLNVSVDTSLIPVSSGALDFQYNSGSPSTASTTAEISQFFSDGSLAAGTLTQGSVSGSLQSLPLKLTVSGPSQNNEFGQAFTFGHSILFDLTIDDVDNAHGSTFAFGMLDSLNAGANGLLTTNPNPVLDPFALEIDIDINGGVTIRNNSAAGALIVTPEPQSITLILLSLVGLASLRLAGNRRRRPSEAR